MRFNTTADLIVRVVFAEQAAIHLLDANGKAQVAGEVKTIVEDIVKQLTATGDPKTVPTQNALPGALADFLKEIGS